MRLRMLLWIVVGLLPAGLARAQDAPAAADVERAFAADGLFRAVNVPFEPGRSTLLPAARATLDAVAEVLVRHPALRLEVAGHTDASGSESANLRLSEERARTVRAYLMGRFFVDPKRLEAVGYGEMRPLADDTPTGRVLNRRVEFRVLNPEVLRPAAPVVPAREAQAAADSVQEALRRQVEAAVRGALGQAAPDTAAARRGELERQLEARLAELERRLAAGGTRAAAPPAARRAGLTGVLPFAGAYLRGDVPVVLGLRAEVATPSLGRARLRPEVAFAFRPHDRATSVAVDLVLPLTFGARPSTVPFVGLGLGLHTLDDAETVLDLVVGAEHRFGLGVLFAEFTTQDFFDYNRVVVGFRQPF